jgi:hypothetical protein
VTELPHLLRGRPGSLTHPLYLATNAPDSSLIGVVKALELSVPAVTHTRRTAGTVKTRTTVFRQQLEYESVSDFHWNLALITQPLDPSLQKYSRIIWSGDITLLSPESYAAELGDCETVVRFRVHSFWLQDRALRGAAELALTRHLLVTYYRTLDPETRVAGGRWYWDPQWWTVGEAGG